MKKFILSIDQGTTGTTALIINKDNFKLIAKHNGVQVVNEKTKEECQELIDAVEHNVIEEVIDEVADVFIMLYQQMIGNDIEKEVYDRIDFKIERTLERLGLK